jgi:hypothetical protein
VAVWVGGFWSRPVWCLVLVRGVCDGVVLHTHSHPPGVQCFWLPVRNIDFVALTPKSNDQTPCVQQSLKNQGVRQASSFRRFRQFATFSSYTTTRYPTATATTNSQVCCCLGSTLSFVLIYLLTYCQCLALPQPRQAHPSPR